MFSKATCAAGGTFACLNLLFEHFRARMPGADDEFAGHGNFLYENPTEGLFQGKSNLALA